MAHAWAANSRVHAYLYYGGAVARGAHTDTLWAPVRVYTLARQCLSSAVVWCLLHPSLVSKGEEAPLVS